jgi:hypothetical protein
MKEEKLRYNGLIMGGNIVKTLSYIAVPMSLGYQ